MKDLISNLTCNPAIIYNLFINNPAANIGGKYKTRDEVLKDIGDILGPGCDISVELNDPFGSSESQILEEAARFSELLSKHRIVIKVPHTGPVNAQNVSELMTGDKKFSKRYNQGATADFYRGHNLALMLREHGYRVGMATSTGRRSATEHLRRTDMLQYFQEDAIITGDMVKNGKPYPDIFLLAARRLGVEPAYSIGVEDSFNGIRAVAAAGMRPVMIPDMLTPTPEIKALAWRTCHSLLDLIPILEEHL
jgi:phosphoglycolate phosphatase-like HAD superfamily hydrolase